MHRPRPAATWLTLLILTGCADVAPPETAGSISTGGCDGVTEREIHRARGLVFARGGLGCADAGDPVPGAVAAVFELRGDAPTGVELHLRRDEVDALGLRHLRFTQTANGLPVEAGDLIVHVAERSGDIVSVTGPEVEPTDDPRDVRLMGDIALARALSELGIVADRVEAPALSYVATAAGETRLAWHARFAYDGADGPELDRVFADAINGELVARHPQYMRALSRRVHTAGNTINLPGTLVAQEGGAPPTDIAARAAWDNSGAVHGFYLTVFGRDSFDAAGAALVSSVHYDVNFNTAFWDGLQMVYGDGDGVQFGQMALGYDVAGHELTHAVTQYEAGLIYANESGALNEAWSDIMGATAEASRDGAITARTWMMGEDVFTPGTPNDAKRYMDNPTADGKSSDNYAERYLGTDDNGGVHLNSGIANLAYKLLVTGGVHPRAITAYQVPALGIDQARQIFYRALTQYMTANTDFAGARLATVQAAQELFGASAASAVHYAWDSVGVAGTPQRVAPTLRFVSPAEGSTVDSGFGVTIEIDQGSVDDLFQVELRAGGALVATATEAPFSFESARVEGDGPLELEIRAVDRSGGETTAAATVMVVVPPDEEMPDGRDGGSATGGCAAAGGAGWPGALLLLAAIVQVIASRRRRRRQAL